MVAERERKLNEAAEAKAEQARQIQEAFRAMDLDGNHTIDIGEFYEVGKVVHGEEGWTEELCEREFQMLDTNGDRSIDEAEFTAHLQHISEKVDKQEFDEMIKIYAQMGQKALKALEVAQQNQEELLAEDARLIKETQEAEDAAVIAVKTKQLEAHQQVAEARVAKAMRSRAGQHAREVDSLFAALGSPTNQEEKLRNTGTYLLDEVAFEGYDFVQYSCVPLA